MFASVKTSASAQRPTAAFTLVEVMMAGMILTVGFIGMIQAVTVCSGMMDQARRQTLAAQILNNEIEQLRLKSWPEIQALGNAAKTEINQVNYPSSLFLDTIENSGATYSLIRDVSYIDPGTNANTATDTGLREVTFTVTWDVATSRRDSGGNPVKFTYTRMISTYFGKYGLNLSYQRS